MKDEDSLISNQKKYSEWDEGIFIILLLMIILVPLAFYPHCIPVFNTVKELILQLLTLIGFTLLLLKLIAVGQIDWAKTSLDKPIFFYLVFGSLSLIWSVNIYNSLIALPLFLVGPLLYYIVSQSLKEQKYIDRLLLVIIIVGTAMALYGILQYFGIDFEFWAGNIARNQVFGLFGNVNYFAEFMILPLSLTIGLFLSKEHIFPRLFLLIALIIMGTALLLTFTRGSLLAIVVTIPVLIFFYYKSAAGELNKKYYRKIALYFLILVIVAAAVIYIPHPLNQKETTLGKLKERVTIESITSGSSILRRVAIWKFTWMMIEDYPLLGSGIGTYGYHSLPYQAEFFAQDNNRDIYPHGFAVQAHNEYLQIWAEMGIIGLLLFLGIIFIYYRNIFINFRKMEEKEKAIIIGLAGGVTAVLVDAIFGFPLQLSASSSLFWLFLGLSSAQININISGLFREETELVNQNQETKQKKVKNARDEISRKNNNPSSGNTIKTIKKIFLSILVIALMIGAISFLIRPFMARVYWYYGNQQIVKGNYQEAIKIYERGLKWNPWQGEMYYDIGNILANEGLNTPALEYLHKAEKYVDHHNLPQKIAVLYIKKGEIGEAIPYLEKAITYQQKKEDMLPLQLQLGNLYLTIKDYQNAERQFQNALQINPESAEAYYGSAGAYVNQGKKEETIAALQKVIELAPESRVAGYAKTMLIKIELEQKEKEQ